MDNRPYHYQITPLAQQDMDEIFDYISFALSSPQASERLIDKIQAAVEQICEFPFSRPLLNDAVLRDKGYRLLVIDNYNLFYIVKPETVVVIRVLYGRRDYGRLL